MKEENKYLEPNYKYILLELGDTVITALWGKLNVYGKGPGM